ncbi:MAG TPA: DUF6777 domain-containing protein [Amycolatopsis sp.]|uniref:DUF6777 domain-containing protein n=1 Tax=Amycolatopsis sp. TaxID=37632 RepID=UPI002B47A377|nr:DUF6777 domain-containing protein [Amycolatopsis sp.]HKS46900.1 DUF6777 domain-containing protein [Amycolatopsis sp.]
MDEMFGQYKLEALIGRGGMGEVYRAFDTVRGRTVALKRLRVELAVDPDFQARFRRECRLAARLREAHVVPIHDFGEIEGHLYLDMRLIEGVDLGTLLAQQGPLPPHRAVDIVSQVAQALDAAHEDGMVHRDVKPSNVLIAAGDFAYLLDFGVVGALGVSHGSLTMTGATIGTLDYMAPERFQHGPVDQRADVYSLACVLHEALTARPPFHGDGLAAKIHAHLNIDPPAVSVGHTGVPPGLDPVIARGMAKDPNERYGTAGALAAAAREAFAAPPPTTAAPSGEAIPTPRLGAGPQAHSDPQWSSEWRSSRWRSSQWPAESGQLPAPAPSPVPNVEPTPATVPEPGWPVVADQPSTTRPTASGPPSRSEPSGPGSAPRGKHRPSWVRSGLVLLAVLLLAAAGAGGWYLASGPGRATDTVVREAVRTTGENPFTPPVGTDQPNVTPPPNSGGTFAGNTEGLYGGTMNNSSCDAQKLTGYLQSHPDKGAAWAGVLGIMPAQIPGYVAGLTPMILRSDTAVTNHGYVDGHATTVHSVLQAGTAVLVDDRGVPRVKCYCGNPLTPPSASAKRTYSGPAWPGFSPTDVTTIQPSNVVINVFVVVNIANNQVILRRQGDTTAAKDTVAPGSVVPGSPYSPSTGATTAGPRYPGSSQASVYPTPGSNASSPAGAPGSPGSQSPAPQPPTSQPPGTSYESPSRGSSSNYPTTSSYSPSSGGSHSSAYSSAPKPTRSSGGTSP